MITMYTLITVYVPRYFNGRNLALCVVPGMAVRICSGATKKNMMYRNGFFCMIKYLSLCLTFFFMASVLVIGVYVCPDFMFLQSYWPNFESLDFITGAYVMTISMSVVSSLSLSLCLIWDFFKRKSSGNKPDKNKNENKSQEDKE